MAKKSEALKLRELQNEAQFRHEIIGLLTDPLWSSVLGFTAVALLHDHDVIPISWADLLIGGIISINTVRSGALTDLVKMAGGTADSAGKLLPLITALAAV